MRQITKITVNNPPWLDATVEFHEPITKAQYCSAQGITITLYRAHCAEEQKTFSLADAINSKRYDNFADIDKWLKQHCTSKDLYRAIMCRIFDHVWMDVKRQVECFEIVEG